MDQSTGSETNLRAHRRGRGVSLRGLSRQAGVDPAYLSRVERGLQPPNLDLAARLLDVLGPPKVAKQLRRAQSFVEFLGSPANAETA